MVKILVIGCASLDTIHIEKADSRLTFHTFGGAGLFTALAAAGGGAATTLYAPRLQFSSLTARGTGDGHSIKDLSRLNQKLCWRGPAVSKKDMPRLEIIHHGQGRATLAGASWGGESLLLPKNLAPEFPLDRVADKPLFDIVHVAALSSPAKQLLFVKEIRRLNLTALISAGTYARAIQSDPASVKTLFDSCDLFFMNSNESHLLFDGAPPGDGRTILAITNGDKGATVFYGGQGSPEQLLINPVKAEEVDPTGAGDTFCGAFLASIAGHDCHVAREQIAQAGRAGARAAAAVIQKPGSDYYLT